MLVPKKTLIDGKNEWTIKQDNTDLKWAVFKNGKKLKTSVHHEVVYKLMPDYKDVYKN